MARLLAVLLLPRLGHAHGVDDEVGMISMRGSVIDEPPSRCGEADFPGEVQDVADELVGTPPGDVPDNLETCIIKRLLTMRTPSMEAKGLGGSVADFSEKQFHLACTKCEGEDTSPQGTKKLLAKTEDEDSDEEEEDETRGGGGFGRREEDADEKLSGTRAQKSRGGAGIARRQVVVEEVSPAEKTSPTRAKNQESVDEEEKVENDEVENADEEAEEDDDDDDETEEAEDKTGVPRATKTGVTRATKTRGTRGFSHREVVEEAENGEEEKHEVEEAENGEEEKHEEKEEKNGEEGEGEGEEAEDEEAEKEEEKAGGLQASEEECALDWPLKKFCKRIKGRLTNTGAKRGTVGARRGKGGARQPRARGELLLQPKKEVCWPVKVADRVGQKCSFSDGICKKYLEECAPVVTNKES